MAFRGRQDRRMELKEPHVACLAQQVLRGLNALHERFFVHRVA